MGKLEPSKEDSVVGRDVTMAEMETAEVVIDNRHRYLWDARALRAHCQLSQSDPGSGRRATASQVGPNGR